MTDFVQYIGVHYTGRKGPGERVQELRVFSARENHQPYVDSNPDDRNGKWSRRELAEWLGERLQGDEPVVVGIDHAFSFPQSYMDRNNLKSWEEFLGDFEGFWPTHRSTVRELLPGNPRTGDPDEHRLTGRWTAFPRSVFAFDMQDSPARATHAGLPWIAYLRRSAGDRVHFWPFDGFEVPAGRSVVAEVRPARFRHRYPKEGLKKGGEQDAYSTCAWLQERDRLGLLRPYFTPPLSDSEKERARLEGWILGVS